MPRVKNTLLDINDRIFRRASLHRHVLLPGVAVVHLVVHEVMRERVEVGMGQPVELDGNAV
jgi:hypothetical protein